MDVIIELTDAEPEADDVSRGLSQWFKFEKRLPEFKRTYSYGRWAPGIFPALTPSIIL